MLDDRCTIQQLESYLLDIEARWELKPFKGQTLLQRILLKLFRTVEASRLYMMFDATVKNVFGHAHRGGYEFAVRGNIKRDGTVKIGTAYPWKK